MSWDEDVFTKSASENGRSAEPRRPMYETPAMVDRERGTKAAYERRVGCVLAKLPVVYRVDYAEHDGHGPGVIARWVELKWRGVAHDYYPTFFLSLGKVQAGLWLFETTGVPFVVVVEFTDGLWQVTPAEGGWAKVALGGRTDRGDPQDIEPMVHWHTRRLVAL